MPEPASKPPSTHSSDPKDTPFPWTNILYVNRKNPGKPSNMDKYKRKDKVNEIPQIEHEKPERIRIDKVIELALASAIACFALLQWLTTIQNNESNLEQTSQLISAANINAFASKQNALAAGNFANSAQHINQGINDAVDKLQAQANATEAARLSSEAESTAALNATIENFQQEQRAWVALDTREVGGVFPHQVFAILKNTGRTPARKVQAISGLFMVRGEKIPNDAYAVWMDQIIEQVRNGKWAGGTVLRTVRQPSDQWRERTKGLSEAQRAEELKKFRRSMDAQDMDGKEVLPVELFGENQIADAPSIEPIGVISPQSTYQLNVRVGPSFGAGEAITVVVYGKIQYEDLVGRPTRATVFCRYAIHANAIDWKSCPVYNDMN
jgi:hypothetical protein